MPALEPSSAQILAWFTDELARGLPPDVDLRGVQISDRFMAADFHVSYGLRVTVMGGRKYRHTVGWFIDSPNVEATVRQAARGTVAQVMSVPA